MSAVDPEGRIRHPLDVFHSTFNPDGSFVDAGSVPVADGLGQVEYLDVGALLASSGHYELLMAAGTSPIEPLETGDGLDWLYVWVP